MVYVSKPPSTESRAGWGGLLTGHSAVVLFLGAMVAAVLYSAIPEPAATAVIAVGAIGLFVFVGWAARHRP